jgi:hypothetical protein
MDGGGRDQVRQMRLGFAQLARLPQAKGPNALRKRSFDPGSQTIALFEGRGCLALTCGLNGLVLGVWTQGQLTRVTRCRGAEQAARTGQAIRLSKLDPDALRLPAIMGRFPLAAELSLWAACLFGLPVNHQACRIKALSCFGAALWDQW